MVKKVCLSIVLVLVCMSLSANSSSATELTAEAADLSSQAAHLDMGFELGWPFYGLKLVCWQGNSGFGLNWFQMSGSSTGWGGESKNNSTHISVRYYYKFKPNTYFALGLGKFDYASSSYSDYSWLSAAGTGTYSNYYYSETLIGIAAGVKASDFIMYEIGYGLATSNLGSSQSRVTYSLTTYFNLF